MQRLYCLLIVLSMIGHAVSAEPDSLLLGEARFALANERPLDVLTLLENTHTGATQIDNHFHNENHLVAMEAALRLGLAEDALKLAEHLLFTAREKNHKQKAMLYKARALYQLGKDNTLLSWLPGQMTLLKGKDRDEALYLLAAAQTRSGKVAEAARTLSAISQGSLWAAYGYFNLATRYAQEDPDSSRALVALRVVAALAGQSEEGMALRDRALTAATDLALRSSDPEKALGLVRQVRAEAIEAPSAIYLMGMAEASDGRVRTAVRTWQRAKKYALMMPGVAETFQAIAWAYMKENLRGSAIDAWLEAVSVYGKEQQQTRQVRKELGQNGFLGFLKAARAEQKTPDWFLNTELANNTPRVMFLNALMTDDAFFDQARELMQLQVISRQLSDNRARLEILANAVSATSRHGKKGGKARLSKLKSQLNTLVQRRNALVNAYQEATARQDFARIGSDRLLQARQDLEQLVADLKVLRAKLPEQDYQKLASRATRVHGRILWEEMDHLEDAKATFRERIQAIDGLINQMRDGLGRVEARLAKGRAHFQARLQQINSLLKRIRAAEKRMNRLLVKADRRVTQMALERLDAHDASMGRYLVRSQLALVNLYDQLAVAEYGTGTETGRPAQ